MSEIPDTPADAPARPPARKRRPVRFALFCTVLVAGGAFGRQAVFPVRVAAAPVHEEAPPPEPPPPAETVARKTDLMLRSGRYADALKLLDAAPADAFGPADRGRFYRVGLAREGARDWAAADAAYRAAADADSDAGEWARAQLGRGRCAAGRGDFPAAFFLLNRVLLASGDPACAGVAGECVHLRGRFAVQALKPPADPDPLDDTVPAYPRLDGGVDEVLDRLPLPAVPRSPDHDGRENPVEVAVRGGKWGPPRVTARGPAAGAAEWVGRVAVAGRWVLTAEPAAAARLAAAGPVRVNVDGVPADELLAALAEPLGVSARARAREIILTVAKPADREAARTAALRAVALAADHPAAGALAVAATNLDYEAGRVAAAAAGYRRFLDESFFTPEALHATHNLGLVELRAGNLAGARTRFLDVIDHAPDGRWGPLGWWWVARTHLDAADTAPARPALARARAGGKGLAAAAVLATALADYLDGNDAAAVPVIRETRFPDVPAHRLTADWFRALARYRTAPSELRAKELCDATAAAGNGRPFGPVGVYFAGQVYREAGFPGRTAELYEAGSALGRGPVPLRMTFDVAEHLYRAGDRPAARQRYLALAATDPAGLGGRAELRLADLAARAGNGAECVARCRRATGKPNVDEDEVLRVMGRGYELLGERLRAAECFAGRIPAE